MMRPDLSELVGSRICHDLISPIGAIGNGVELLALTDGDTAAEMDLISESVANANARIRYFRIAYGAANADQFVSRAEVLSVLAAIARSGRFTYSWQVDEDQPRQIVRAVFLTLQCLESALPMGGSIHISQNSDRWTLSAEGRRVNVDEKLWRSLLASDASYSHSAAQVQFALLPDALAAFGRQLSVDFGENRITARF